MFRFSLRCQKTTRTFMTDSSRFQKMKFTTRLLAEIKTYLVTLQSENSPLLKEIVKFTSSFDGYKGFKIENYIKAVNAVVTKGTGAADFSIALPGIVMMDYLQRQWGRESRLISKRGPICQKKPLG